MKKKCAWLVSLTLVGLIISSSGLFAGSKFPRKGKSIGIGLDAGYILLSQKQFNGCAVFGLNLFYSIGNKLRIELKGSFFSSDVDDNIEGLSEGKLKVIPIQLSLQYRFKINQRLIPYIGAGAGYYFNDFSLGDTDEWRSLGFIIKEKVDNAAGFHFGAGMDYFLKANLAANFDIRYCISSPSSNYSITDDQTGISQSGDFNSDLNHIIFGAGIKYIF